MKQVAITVNGKSFTATLEDSATSRAFLQLLPLDANMQELNGNEKYYRLAQPLPSSPTSVGTIEAGDLMLYQDNTIVLFYETFPTSYTYTRIGKLDNAAGLASAVGAGESRVRFEAIG